jgi:glycosyltransferase involved in cell wall biosynthesis
MLNNAAKIIRIQSRIVIGGPALHTICLSDKLNPELFETTLVGGAGDEDERSMIMEAQRRNITCIEIPELGRDIHFYDDLISFFKVFQIIRRIKPDIVHTHTAKAGAIGRLAAFFASVPFIYHTFHGHVFTGYFNPVKTKIFILIERLLAKLSTKIIVISHQQKADIVEKFKIAPEDKVSLIPLGFEWDSPSNPKHDRFDLKEKYNIPANKFVIAIVGRLVPIKDHFLFIQITESLVALNDRKYHFVVIGDGEMREILEQRVQEKKLTDHFTFTGWITDTRALYQGIDLLLLTSKNEGTPVTIIEALAYGVPVVARDVGGVTDIFEFYDRNYLITGDNPQDYVQAVCKIAAGKVKISEETKRQVKAYYGAQRLVSDMEKLYLSMINQKREQQDQ